VKCEWLSQRPAVSCVLVIKTDYLEAIMVSTNYYSQGHESSLHA
jgi:hypothetical protein